LDLFLGLVFIDCLQALQWWLSRNVPSRILFTKTSPGASLGVTTPMTTTITPSTEFDRSKVIGTMLKIQGSTRSVKDMQSSKLVWSLEENEQQCTGLPREFTFVFLVEQPVARAPFTLQVAMRPVLSQSMDAFKMYNEVVAKSDISADEVGQKYVLISHGSSVCKERRAWSYRRHPSPELD
jgi:hypothetical protein